MSQIQNNIAFEKMHGAGNDFIVMDARSDSFPTDQVTANVPALCNRRTGIGADGILLLRSSITCDYTMDYRNADGSEAGMCGNGARCLARFAQEQGISSQQTFQVREHTYKAEVHDAYVSIHFPAEPIPVLQDIEDSPWYVLHTGTEHIVSIEDGNAALSYDSIRQTGRRLRNRSDLFPHGTNVNFAHVINENRLKLTTYERGVEDITMACGTGAIATAIAWEHKKGGDIKKEQMEAQTEHFIQIDCPGGPLEVTFDVIYQRGNRLFKNIKLHGPAASVFKGQIRI